MGPGIVGVRMLQRESLRQALGGLLGLAIAVVFALGSGDARGYVLTGSYVHAASALIFAGSVAAGRPLGGAICGLVDHSYGGWRSDPRVRRGFAVATPGWALTAAAVVLTLAYVRRIRGPHRERRV